MTRPPFGDQPALIGRHLARPSPQPAKWMATEPPRTPRAISTTGSPSNSWRWRATNASQYRSRPRPPPQGSPTSAQPSFVPGETRVRQYSRMTPERWVSVPQR
jgi:hypothetical protein